MPATEDHTICRYAFAVGAALLGWAHPAAAQEVFAGTYVHGVDTPFTLETGEGGVDFQAGVRFAPIQGLSFLGKPAPYVMVSVNASGETSFGGAGLGWTLGKGRFYVRPGIGLVIHDGPSFRLDPATQLRTDLGSRVLFAPEIAAGVRLSPKWSAEASWVHVSHARLFGEQNPGLDMVGIRINYRLN